MRQTAGFKSTKKEIRSTALELREGKRKKGKRTGRERVGKGSVEKRKGEREGRDEGGDEGDMDKTWCPAMHFPIATSPLPTLLSLIS